MNKYSAAYHDQAMEYIRKNSVRTTVAAIDIVHVTGKEGKQPVYDVISPVCVRQAVFRQNYLLMQDTPYWSPKKMSLMREKSYGGVLVRKSATIAKYVFCPIPQEVFCKAPINKGITLFNERRVKATVERLGMNVWRNLFDYWMATETGDAGAEIRKIRQ